MYKQPKHHHANNLVSVNLQKLYSFKSQFLMTSHILIRYERLNRYAA